MIIYSGGRAPGAARGYEISFVAFPHLLCSLNALSFSLRLCMFEHRDGFSISCAAEEAKGREIWLSNLASPSHWLSIPPAPFPLPVEKRKQQSSISAVRPVGPLLIKSVHTKLKESLVLCESSQKER